MIGPSRWRDFPSLRLLFPASRAAGDGRRDRNLLARDSCPPPQPRFQKSHSLRPPERLLAYDFMRQKCIARLASQLRPIIWITTPFFSTLCSWMCLSLAQSQITNFWKKTLVCMLLVCCPRIASFWHVSRRKWHENMGKETHRPCLAVHFATCTALQSLRPSPWRYNFPSCNYILFLYTLWEFPDLGGAK